MSDPVNKIKKLSMKLARLGFDILFVMDYPDASLDDEYAMFVVEGIKNGQEPNPNAAMNRLLNQMKYCMELGGYKLEFKIRKIKEVKND